MKSEHIWELLSGFKPKLANHTLLAATYFFVLLVIIGFASPFVMTVYADGVLSVDINITGNPATVETNEIIEYVIDFSCAGTTGDCGTLQIDFPLDPDTDFVEVVTASGYTAVLVGNTIQITDTNLPFNDGDASQAIVRVRAKVDLLGGEPVDVTVTGTIGLPDGGAPPVNQSAPTVVVSPPTEQWSVTKTQTVPSGGIGPAENGQATYQVQFCPDSNTGNILLNNVTMVDTYPPGAVVIDADGGVDDGTSITWNLGNLTPNDPCQTRNVVLQFPAGTFTTNDLFNNLVEGYGENTNFPPSAPCTQPNCIGSTTYNGTIDPPEANPAQGKSGPGGGVIVSPGGGSSVFTLNLNTLAANVAVENVILVDTLPKAISDPTLPAFEIDSINSGRWAGGTQVSVEYSTNDGASWASLGIVDGSANTTWNATVDFPLVPPITNLRWVFDPAGLPPTLPAGFVFAQNPNYRFIPHPNLLPIDFDDGTSTPPTRSYSNCVTTTYIDPMTSAPATTGPNCDSVLLSEDPSGFTNVVPSKSVSGSPVDVLDTMQFTLTATMTQEGSGAIINPSFEDILPPYLTLNTGVPFTATFTNFTSAPPQPYLVTQAVGPNTQLVFYWDDVIRAGAVDSSGNPAVVINPLSETAPFAGDKLINITFTVDVALNAPSGLHDNSFTLVSDSPNQLCQGGLGGTDAGDIDIDTNSSETTCSITTQYEVREAAAMLSQKWDRSIVGPFPFLDSNNLDNTSPACPSYTFGGNSYTRFPCVAQGIPGGAFETAYVFQNAGLVRVNNYIMYDILPHVNDTGVSQALATQARNSEFTGLLTGPLVQQNVLNSATFIVEYNTDPAYNPCRPEMSNTADETGWQGACNNTWVTAAGIGGAWNTVTSFRIRQTGGQIDVGETLVFLSPMEIIDYTPPFDTNDAETGEIAWNNFAQRFNNFESGSRLLTAEPRKVGIIVVEKYSVGNRVWIDDGAGAGVANNGLIDGGEAGLDGVTVELLNNVGAVIAADITHEGGYYIFDDLDAGTYSIRIPASQFVAAAPLDNYASSTGNTTIVDNASDVDNDDNGVDPAILDDYTAGISSNTFTLARNNEPINETDLNINGSSGEGPQGRGSTFEEDRDSDLTIDFGFYRPMSLGNRVWFDTGAGALTNNGLIDPGETGVDGVLVNLYYDANEDGAITGAELATPIATDTTANGGYYLFDMLPQGNYLVQVDPSAFAFGATPATDGPLARYITSTGNQGDTQTDNDDNGIDPPTQGDQRINGVFSPLIVLQENIENPAETDKEPTNPNPDGRRTNFANSELTVDFGFFQQLTQMSLGNRVWLDDGTGGGGANDGLFNGAEVGIDGVVLNLYLDDNSDGIPDDNGAPGLADDIIDTQTTANGGLYLFDNLDPGRYIVEIPASNWTAGTGALDEYVSSTPTTATENIDNNDNGINQATYADYVALGILSNTIQLVPQGEPIAGDTDDPPLGIGNADGDNNSDNTVDFGVYKPMSIGNRVWLDNGAGGGIRNNGIQDGTEAGILGVGVTLYLDANGNGTFEPGAGDTIVDTDTTDGGGYYLFDDLGPGTYFVWVDNTNFQGGGALVTLDSSFGNDGDNGDDIDDNGIDDNFPATNGIVSVPVVLVYDTEPTGEIDLSADPGDGPAGERRGTNGESDDNSDLTIDFGFDVPVFSIGNRVWFDPNNNGLIDGGETGFANVTVFLYADADMNGVPDGAPIATDITNGGGYYLFDNLPQGNYVVGIDELEFRIGGDLIDYFSSTPAFPDDGTDNDDNGINSIDPQIGGILSPTIELAKNTETITESDPSGDPTDGPTSIGNNGELDSNSDIAVDFGLYKPMSIGNRVWFDPNDSGTIDGVETGIANVTVNLYRDDNGNGTFEPGELVGTDVTNADGYYLFGNLIPGSYQVEIPATEFNGAEELVGLASSTGNATDDTDSNDNGIDDPTPNVNGIVSNPISMLLDGQPINEPDFSNDPTDGPGSIGNNGETDNNSDITVDFGFVAGQMSLGNRVWLDPNNSGDIDAADGATPGIGNVVVSLYRDVNTDGIPDGLAIRTDTTDADGYYIFDGLTPGDYVVGLDNSNFLAAGPLDGLISSTGNTGDTGVDSDDNGIDALDVTFGLITETINLARDSEVDTEIDLGLEGDGTNGETAINSELTIDFGLFEPLSLGNRVWFDPDDSGTINGVENGVANVVVNLFRDDNNDNIAQPGELLATDTTDANGYYLFDGLGEADYIVVVDPANFQAGNPLEGSVSSTGDNNTPTDSNDNGIDDPTPGVNGIRSNLITLTLGGAPLNEADLGPDGLGSNGETDDNSDLSIDFGFLNTPMSLGNRVWFDDGTGGGVARDGLRDATELGAANVAVSLYFDTDADGIPDGPAIATDTTDANGYYLFDGLAPGNYLVGLDANNFLPAGALDGYTSTTDGVPDTDDNDNGVDNPNPPLNGILSNTVTLQLTTEPLNETDLGPDGLGANGETDDNSNLTVDFGVYKPMSLGNRVWFDPDDSGTINGTETGIAGVDVSLFLDADLNGVPDGAAIATDTTDSNGFYLFDDLDPGSYLVGVDPANFNAGGVLVGFSSSTGNTADNTDSNDNGIDDPTYLVNGILSNTVALVVDTTPTGETDLSGDAADGPNFRGTNGESDNNSDLTVDFGFVAGVMSLGNRVWIDDGAGGGTADDGTIDGGELGVASVVVNLYADVDMDGVPDGLAITSDTTDADGYYLFDGLPPGNYVVQVDPTNFQTGNPLFGLFSSAGADGTLDTDNNDNGIDNPDPAANGVLSQTIPLIANNAPTTETDFGPEGDGTNGETNDNSNLSIDFGFATRFDLGDAPDSYGTLVASTGPRHRIISTLFLGAVVDDEGDGQPSVGADGDDTAGSAPDDEDGITLPTLVAGTTIDLEFTVFNDTGSDANLVGWIDFDGNGTFDPGEAIIATIPSDPNTQVVQVPITIPIDADVTTGGSTYARFRLTTDPLTGADPLGIANDGEIEDYVVSIAPPGVAITKTDGQSSMQAGQATTYVITLTNSGLDVVNRNITDTLPTADPDGFDPATITWTCTATNGASCISGQPAGTGSVGSGPINEFIDIPRNGTLVYQLTATLRANYSAADVTNTAALALGPSASDVNTVVTDPPTGRKTGVAIGSNGIRWTIVWENTGPLQTATITDPLRAGQAFDGNLTCNTSGVSTTTSCIFAGNTVTWTGNIGTGNANRVEIVFDVRVAGNAAYGNLSTINIGGTTADAVAAVTVGNPPATNNPSGNSGNSSGNPPPLGYIDPAIVKFGNPAFALPGEIVTWTIQVSNPNNVPLSNVGFSDTVPSQMQIQSVSSTAGSVSSSGQSVSFLIGTLNPGQTVTVSVVTTLNQVNQAMVITNLALLNDPYAGQAEATVFVIFSLPETGESPWSLWRVILPLSFAGIVLYLGIRQYNRKQAIR